MPTDELLEQPSKLNKSKKFSLLRKSEETLIVNVKYSMIDLILESLTYMLDNAHCFFTIMNTQKRAHSNFAFKGTLE